MTATPRQALIALAEHRATQHARRYARARAAVDKAIADGVLVRQPDGTLIEPWRLLDRQLSAPDDSRETP